MDTQWQKMLEAIESGLPLFGSGIEVKYVETDQTSDEHINISAPQLGNTEIEVYRNETGEWYVMAFTYHGGNFNPMSGTGHPPYNDDKEIASSRSIGTIAGKAWEAVAQTMIGYRYEYYDMEKEREAEQSADTDIDEH